jgi:hypothetical protein
MRLPFLQPAERRIYLTTCVIREERVGGILFVWLGMTACMIKGGERELHAAQPDTNGRANVSAQMHSWRIFGPCLRQNGHCIRFASCRCSAFFIRVDANGRKSVLGMG